LDEILENPKFDNRQYSISIIEKTEALSDIFAEDSIPYLAMKYISVKLSSKVKTLPILPLEEEVVEDIEEETHNAAEIIEEEAEEEAEETKTTTSNEYNNGFLLPVNKEKIEAPKGKMPTDEDLSGFNLGKQEIPA
jgi:hypothetical protein